MNQRVESFEELSVGKDTVGHSALVDAAVGEEDPVAQETTQVVEEINVVVIACGHSVADETGHSQRPELGYHGTLAAAHASCDAYPFHLMMTHCTSWGSTLRRRT